MKTSTYKAMAEHVLLGFLFVVAWGGPILKLFGVIHCSWWRALAVLEITWAGAILLLIVKLIQKARWRHAN